MTQKNLLGKVILGYTVVEKLGTGAFGTVYRVEKTNAAGQFIRALKHITIPSEREYYSVLNSMGGDASKADNYFSHMLEGIISEIKILSSLSEKGGQNIVRYYENDIVISENPKRYDIYILMEYLTPLEDFYRRTDFRVRDVLRLGLDILTALQLCHENGVIHRDIKDDNIFVSGAGQYKIGDFGVSKVLKDSSKAESLKGTPNFLAPEVYLGKESYTKSVDLYSLGIVLYRLLNYYRNPFLPSYPGQYFSQDEEAAFEKRMMGETPDLPLLGGEAIGRVIVKAISGKSERFQSAAEFREALESAIEITPQSIVECDIRQDITNQRAEPEEKNYNETVKENNSWTISEEKESESYSESINKYLFMSYINENDENYRKSIEPEIIKSTTAAIDGEKDHCNQQFTFVESELKEKCDTYSVDEEHTEKHTDRTNDGKTKGFFDGKKNIEFENILGIGIDLGYSCTRIAAVANREIIVLTDQFGSSEFPSVISDFSGSTRIKGSIQNSNKNKEIIRIWDLLSHSDNNFTDSDMEYLIHYFKQLFRTHSWIFKHPVKVVIALPNAVIGTEIPERVKNAAEKAGIRNLRIISASAVQAINQFSLHPSQIENEAFFISCGEQYLSISHAESLEGTIEMINEVGFQNNCGSSLDRGIASFATSKLLSEDQKKIMSDEEISKRILLESKKVKHELSYKSSSYFEYPENFEKKTARISRDDLNELMNPITAEIINYSRKFNPQSKKVPVFVTGKMLKNPVLQETLEQCFQHSCFFNLDIFSIAKGASLYSVMLTKRFSDFLLLEIIPFSIAVQFENKVLRYLIPEQTCIPALKVEAISSDFISFGDSTVSLLAKKEHNPLWVRKLTTIQIKKEVLQTRSGYIKLSIDISSDHQLKFQIINEESNIVQSQIITLW